MTSTHDRSRSSGYRPWETWPLEASYQKMQAANAPIASLGLTRPVNENGTAKATATVNPRGPLSTDGPSWTLKGYKLAVRVTDTSGTVVGGTVVDLPEITPGDAAVQVPVSWKHDASAATVRISLLSPQGFQEETTTVGLKAPAKSEITATATASGSVRVRFSNAVDGVKHKVTATAPDGTVVKASPETTGEPFADLTGLTNGIAYTVSVTAVNDAGSSAPATTTATPAGTLPAGPNIVKVTPVDKGLVLGYTDDKRDVDYRVSVTDTTAGSGTPAMQLTKARPGTRIEGLTPGHTYSLRIQQVAADGKTAVTAWSEPVEATVPAPDTAPALRVKGAIGGTTSGAIAVDPAPGTIRYEVTVGDDVAFTVVRSAIDLIPVDHLRPGTSTPVTVKAVGPNGASPAWSGTITTTGS